VVRDRKQTKSSFISFILCLLGIPCLFIIIPLAILSRLVYKVIGLKPPKALPGVNIDTNEITNPDERKFDVVLFGVTGFTGNLAARYLAKTYGNKVRWAIAGRNLEGLKKVREQLSSIDSSLKEIPILECDSTKPDLLRKVVSQTRVIITTVGPFTLYGTPLVSLCAQLGTSYCDITGEVEWVRNMIHNYHTEATKSGATIIHLAGLDSVPWDICTLQIVNKLKEKGESLTEIEIFDELRASMSGGTLETILLAINHPKKQTLPFDTLLTDKNGKKSENRVENKGPMFIRWSNTFKKWVTPFIMASTNSGVVRRSNAVLDYSKKIVYKEAQAHCNFMTAFVNAFTIAFLLTSLNFYPLQWLLKKFMLPKPGSGPSKEEMDKNFIKITCIGKGDKGSKVKCMLYFPTDPGYRDTARIVVENRVNTGSGCR